MPNGNKNTLDSIGDSRNTTKVFKSRKQSNSKSKQRISDEPWHLYMASAFDIMKMPHSTSNMVKMAQL